MKTTTDACGCCEGIEIVTPEPTANRPGLSALSYRIGTHASFMESMLARLSSSEYPKLAELKTRETDDPAIAILDAWALVADVLTFYNERIINEGYLRTAMERRSILELARLVGYKLRPGVSSSVYLAYTLDDNFRAEVVIPKGARSQSIPGPGELPQSFETSEELKARALWNNLRPRMSRPQTFFSILLDPKGPRIYLKGLNTNLKPNDPLLIDFWSNDNPSFFRIAEVVPEPIADRSLVRLLTLSSKIQTNSNSFNPEDPLEIFGQYDDVDILLLDDSTGLPGFFWINKENSNGLTFELISSLDDSRWLMELEVGFENDIPNVIVYLNKRETELSYKAETIEVIEIGSNEVLQFKYVRLTLTVLNEYKNLLTSLILSPSLQPKNELRLLRNLTEQLSGKALEREDIASPEDLRLRKKTSAFVNNFGNRIFSSSYGSVQGLDEVSDVNNAIVKNLAPLLSANLAIANANANVTGLNPIKVYALRNKAAPFGHNAPSRQVELDQGRNIYKLAEWAIADPLNERKLSTDTQTNITATEFHTPQKLYLDADYEILPNSWVVIEDSALQTKVIRFNNDSIQHGALAAYGISGKSTLLSFNQDKWFVDGSSYEVVRKTCIYIQSEEMELSDESLSASVCGGTDDLIELNKYYEDIKAGQWVVVSGERADVTGTSGVRSSELAMISFVKQDVNHQLWEGRKDAPNFNLPGDKTHTFIKLAEPLQYCFKRETVTINANVVKATHGETRKEVLGSGDGAKALQAFNLKQPPLTYVPASNPSGVDSTLKLYVNDIQWHEKDALAGLLPTDRGFVTKTDDEAKTTVIFGNGREGARLPTGIENIKAEYRNGIGKVGNVEAAQISLLTTRPLGVKEVINPLPASGGADRESRDQARKNAPLAIKALDRLVSVQDYEDFTRTYAGIGKARAAELSDGRRQIVHITIAGSDDIPIDKNSDLYRNLRQSLLDFGDPYQPIQLEIRELMFVVIQANIRVLPDYLWEPVVTQVRKALLDAFSFERRELGQDVLLSELLSVMQAVQGVAYVDVDAFGGIPEKQFIAGKGRQLLTPDEIAALVNKFVTEQQNRPETRITVNLADFEQEAKSFIHPAQLAFLTPEVPATLILNQIT